MDAHADRLTPLASGSPADRYRRALETAAWARADFVHPSAAEMRRLTPVAPRPRSMKTARSRRLDACALAVNGLAMCASFALAAFAGYLR